VVPFKVQLSTSCHADAILLSTLQLSNHWHCCVKWQRLMLKDAENCAWLQHGRRAGDAVRLRAGAAAVGPGASLEHAFVINSLSGWSACSRRAQLAQYSIVLQHQFGTHTWTTIAVHRNARCCAHVHR
jgi:hypothetical protein